MNKKRSLGVTIFGYFGFLIALSYIIESAPEADLYSILYSLSIIFLSYNLLKLRNWARVALLTLNSVILLLISVSYFLISVWFPQAVRQITGPFLEAFKMLYPLSAHIKIFESVFPDYPILELLLFLMTIVYLLGFLILFTRPGVNEQFKQDKTRELNIALMLVNFIIILLFVLGIILIFKGREPAYFNNKPKVLREIRRKLTKLPCLRWYKQIETEMGSVYYLYCQKDEDCLWFPSCEFGCGRAINTKNTAQLQERILEWEQFCWQSNPCTAEDYACPQREVECINYYCQPALRDTK
ncbi:hypothetical protein ACFL1D_05715 [Candidatus Omnitrophota bacterium]